MNSVALITKDFNEMLLEIPKLIQIANSRNSKAVFWIYFKFYILLESGSQWQLLSRSNFSTPVKTTKVNGFNPVSANCLVIFRGD